jgi:endonuclease YncB( thermonuclease family)
MKLKANFIRVIDGDTAYIAVKVRLSNVYAPELNTTIGKVEKARFKAWAKQFDNILVTPLATDEYGRMVGLVENNEGVRYE